MVVPPEKCINVPIQRRGISLDWTGRLMEDATGSDVTVGSLLLGVPSKKFL